MFLAKWEKNFLRTMSIFLTSQSANRRLKTSYLPNLIDGVIAFVKEALIAEDEAKATL